MLWNGLIFLLGVLCYFPLRDLLDLELHPPLWFPKSNELMLRDSWLQKNLRILQGSLIRVWSSPFPASQSQKYQSHAKIPAEVSKERWSSQANVTSGEFDWASLSWALHLRVVGLGVAPSPWVQGGWVGHLVEKVYEKNPAMKLITSQGNGMRESSKLSLVDNEKWHHGFSSY